MAALSPEGRAAVKCVLNSLEREAFLTQDAWLPEELIMPWMNPMIVKAWSKLEAYIDFESRRRSEPDYYWHARQLAERCTRWCAENVPRGGITWTSDAL